MIPFRWCRVLLGFALIVAVLALVDVVASMATADPVARDWVATAILCFLLVGYGRAGALVLPLVAIDRLKIDHEAHRRPQGLLDQWNMCAGKSPPKVALVVLDTEKLVAHSAGVPSRGVIFLSRGVVRGFDDRALQFLLAHELGHIALRHAFFQVCLLAAVLVLKTAAVAPGWMGLVLLLAYMAICRRCEFAADKFAAKLVGAGAVTAVLQRVAAASGEPMSRAAWKTALCTHPSFQQRMERLVTVELDRTGGLPVK